MCGSVCLSFVDERCCGRSDGGGMAHVLASVWAIGAFHGLSWTFHCLSLPFTAFHRLSLPFIAFHCLYCLLSPFTAFRFTDFIAFTAFLLPFLSLPCSPEPSALRGLAPRRPADAGAADQQGLPLRPRRRPQPDGLSVHAGAPIAVANCILSRSSQQLHWAAAAASEWGRRRLPGNASCRRCVRQGSLMF